MTRASVNNRRYRRRLRKRLIALLGGKCLDCERKRSLEFAHTQPTGLSGAGRGSYERLRDVRRNPGCYALLCRPCHVKFDNDQVPF